MGAPVQGVGGSIPTSTLVGGTGLVQFNPMMKETIRKTTPLNFRIDFPAPPMAAKQNLVGGYKGSRRVQVSADSWLGIPQNNLLGPRR